MADVSFVPNRATMRNQFVVRATKADMKLNRKQRKQVKALIRNKQELKFIAGTTNLTTVSSTGATTGSPFDVAQGDTDNTRDGDRLQWCGKMEMMLRWQAGDVTNLVRLIVFQWHPSSTPTLSDILLAGPTGAVDTMSLHHHDNRQQYRIIFDKTWSLVGNGSAATAPYTTSSQIIRKYRISLKKCRKYAQYAAGSLTGTNRFYVSYISDSGAASHPDLTYSFKTFFRDS